MSKLTNTYKEKTVSELEKSLLNLRNEVGKLQVEYKVNPVKDTNTVAKRKKEIAVVMTFLNQKRVQK